MKRMKTLLVYLIVIFMVAGCAGAGKLTKSYDTESTPEKFDLGEFHFRWVVMFPLEIFVGIFSGTLFMTREEVEQLTLGMERPEKGEGKSKLLDRFK